MIDNFSIIFFGALIIYTAYRAMKLDKMTPWFQIQNEQKKIVLSEEYINKI